VGREKFRAVRGREGAVEGPKGLKSGRSIKNQKAAYKERSGRIEIRELH
jgi:hypothetical protein